MLQLSDVTVRYGDTAAVDDVSLDLATGQVLAVLGPSGCGKSTLLRAVAGLEPLSAGSISWDGADLAGVPTHRRGFALMFQDGQLFGHLSVARNVAYALRLRRTPARSAPSHEIDPDASGSSPATARSRVDLPQPEGPSTASTRPAARSSDTWSTAAVSP